MQTVTQTDTERHECAHSAPIVASTQRPGEGALRALGTTTAPPSAPFLRSQNRKPVCQAARAQPQHNCQPVKAAHCPTDPGFPCFMRGSCCSCCARSRRPPLPLPPASSTAPAPSAGGRAKADNQGCPEWTAREDSAPLGPLVPSHGESFARFAVPQCFLGFEMSNISAILSKEYKACNHSNFFLSLKRNKLYICIHTTCIHVLCIFSHMCTYLHTHLQDHSHSVFLFLGKHPAIFNRNGLLLEVHNVMGQRLERKDALSPSH